MQVLYAPRGMIDHPCPNLYKPPDYRVYGWLGTLPPERRIPDHVEQVIGEASDKEPCLIRADDREVRARVFRASWRSPLSETGQHRFSKNNS